MTDREHDDGDPAWPTHDGVWSNKLGEETFTTLHKGMSLWDYYAGQPLGELACSEVNKLSDDDLAAIIQTMNAGEMVPYIKSASPTIKGNNFLVRAKWEAELRAKLRCIDADAMIALKRRREKGTGAGQGDTNAG